tara:strand:+ start:6556 stop:7038 length:483 start_codon:yes stop_codon:yes gene_type:complete
MIDTLVFVVIMFILGLFIVFGYKLMSMINTEFQLRDDMSSTAKGHISDLDGKYVNLFDGIFFTVLIMLALAIAVGAYFVYLHPVFYVPSIFIVIFVVIITAILANTFSDITTDNDIVDVRNEFTLMTFIMDSYLTYVLFLVFAIVIVTYAKFKGEGASEF